MNMLDLAKAIAPECRIEIVGIRPGEKLHEVMVPLGDGRNTLEFDDHFVILHPFHEWGRDDYSKTRGGIRCAEDFEYSSARTRGGSPRSSCWTWRSCRQESPPKSRLFSA